MPRHLSSNLQRSSCNYQLLLQWLLWLPFKIPQILIKSCMAAKKAPSTCRTSRVLGSLATLLLLLLLLLLLFAPTLILSAPCGCKAKLHSKPLLHRLALLMVRCVWSQNEVYKANPQCGCLDPVAALVASVATALAGRTCARVFFVMTVVTSQLDGTMVSGKNLS